MPHEIAWHRDNEVLYVRRWGAVTVADVLAVNEEILAFLEQAATTMHIVVDVRGIGESLVTPGELRNIAAVGTVSTHPRLGVVVYFDRQNPYYNFLVTAVGQTFGERMRFVDTEAQALSLIDSMLNKPK